jgi:hypothetical protein
MATEVKNDKGSNHHSEVYVSKKNRLIMSIKINMKLIISNKTYLIIACSRVIF